MSGPRVQVLWSPQAVGIEILLQTSSSRTAAIHVAIAGAALVSESQQDSAFRDS